MKLNVLLYLALSYSNLFSRCLFDPVNKSFNLRFVLRSQSHLIKADVIRTYVSVCVCWSRS